MLRRLRRRLAHLARPARARCRAFIDAEFAAALASLLAAGVARRRRRAGRPRRRGARGGTVVLALVALIAAPASAAAGDAPPRARAARHSGDARGRTAESVAACGPLCRPLAGELRAFGSVNELAFGLAAELQVSGPRFGLAVGADFNPWVRHLDLVVTAGTLSPYLSGVHRLPLGRVSLRQRASAGVSILLQAAHPHPGGAAGPFFEFAPLGAEFYGRRARFAFVLDGISIAIPIVGLSATPLTQTQYRLGFGFRV